MKHEKSCGIIPVLIKDKDLYVLLIKQNNGVVGFPKGHVEAHETEQRTALRECLEETNVKASLIEGFREEISYYIPEYDVQKKVVFFLGFIDNCDFKRQESEIAEIQLVKMDEAYKLISFDQSKDLLTKAYNYLTVK